MSFLVYNNIGLELLKTNSVDRKVKYSDDETEYVHTEFTINVTAAYNPAQGATTYSFGNPPQYVPGNLPMETDSAIRHFLMQPRKYLIYQEGGIDILIIEAIDEFGNAIDAYNGPIPMSCTITRIAGVSLFYVNYVVKCFVIECPEGTDCQNPATCCALVSSRYARSEQLDDQYRSTLITNGIAYFRSDILDQMGVDADYFRSFLIPPQANGYKRVNVQFSIAANGLMVEWTTYDREQFVDLGSIDRSGTAASVGITDMELRYSARSALGNSGAPKIEGYGAYVNVTASAKGQRWANTLNMVIFLMVVCVQKLGSIFPGAQGATVAATPAGTAVSEDVFRKEVSITIDYFCQPVANAGLAAVDVPIIGFIGQSPQGPFLQNLPDLGGLNPIPPFASGTRGTTAYILAVKAFAEACYCSLCPSESDFTGTINDFNNFCTPYNLNGQIPSVQGLPPPVPPETPYYRSPGENFRSLGNPQQTAYLEYRIDNDVDTDTGIKQMPIASPPPQSSLGSPSSTSSVPPNDASWYNNPACVNIRLHNPISCTKVTWSITRTGCIPEPPDPRPSQQMDSYYTLLKRQVSPKAVQLDSSGGIPVYRLTGIYWYSTTNSVPNEAFLPFPVPPYVTITQNLGIPNPFIEIEPEDWEQGIINNPTTSSG